MKVVPKSILKNGLEKTSFMLGSQDNIWEKE